MDNLCGKCKHWHEWPEEKQECKLKLGDCDKVAKGTPFDEFKYDGYSFEDEEYDYCFNCFEEGEE